MLLCSSTWVHCFYSTLCTVHSTLYFSQCTLLCTIPRALCTCFNVHFHSNALSPKVEFCGYSAPHPSEHKIHVRIQTRRGAGYTAKEALGQALDDVVALAEHTLSRFHEAIDGQ